MFSFLTSRTTKSAPSSHPSQQSRSVNFDQSTSSSNNNNNNPSNLEGGYDDVSLESGGGGGSFQSNHINSSRPDFSRQLSSADSFVGGGGAGSGRHSAQSSPQYPPVPETTRPSPTSGYPSLRSTFIRLETHLANSAPSLLDSLSPPLVPNSPSLLSLMNAIKPYQLPQSVIDAYNLHDGQDPFASSQTGLVWGLWWMPLDLVEIEWRFWRKFEDAGGTGGMEDAFSASTERGSQYRKSREDERRGYDNGHGRIEEEAAENGQSGGGMSMIGMTSFPKGWVRRKYSHPGWLPLLTDRAGNYVGVDLDPPSPSSSYASNSPSTSKSTIEGEGYGQPGQVIAFGREIDEKVVLFPGDSVGGWGRFLAGFTDDVIRGEFARLGEVKRGKRMAWGGENGKRGSGSEEEDWDEGDGIGESSYLDGDRYGDEGEESGSEEDIWTLRSQYRKWLSESGEGGIVGVLAERSRRKWQSVGVGLPPPHDSETTPNPSRNALSVFVPNREDIEPGPESGATERPRSPQSSIVPVQEVEVTLSPPSPPKRFSHQQGSTSISSNTTTTSSRSTASRDYLNDGRRPSSSSNNNKPRRRAPPPAPMALDLPTMFDISYSSSSSSSILPPSDQPYQISPRVSYSNTIRRDSPSFMHTATSTPSHSNEGTPTKLGRTDSTMRLVEPDEGEDLSLAGLGIGSSLPTSSLARSGSNDLMEIVVS